MPDSTVTFPMGGGLNRSVASHLSDPEDFWELLNFRPSRDEKGAVELTPRFRLLQQFSAGTVWNGSTSVAESSTASVRGVYYYGTNQMLAVTEYSVRAGTAGSTTQQQVYQQSVSVGTGTTQQTGCHLQINSLGSLGIALGSSLDVEIDAATTFKWRKNGGAWTTGVAIANSVSIDSGNATVFFLTTTGFTVGHWWKWTRTDSLFLTAFSTPGAPRQASFVPYEGKVYFINGNVPDVWKLDNNPAGETYVISAGYRPFAARHLTSFANHLIAVGYYFNPTYNGDALLSWNTGIAWSDRDNFDNFLATDTNEADVFYFPKVLSYSTTSYVVVAHEINGRLYVVLNNAIWSTTYLGLPTVFNFEHFVWTGLNYQSAATEQTAFPLGNFIAVVNDNGIYFFDGVNLRNVGAPVMHKLTAAGGFGGAVWLQNSNEFCFLTPSQTLIYQLETGLWYSRGTSFADTQYCLGADYDGRSLLVGSISRNIHIEDYGMQSSPANDASSGASLVTATITKHLFHGDSFLKVKELLGLIYAHVQTSSSPSSTYYSTVANAWLKLYYRIITPTTLQVGMPSSATDASLTWKTTNNFEDLSGPRVAFRGIALELQAYGNDSGKPPMGVLVYGIEAAVRGYEKVEK